MQTPLVGQIWGSEMDDGKFRRARIEALLEDGQKLQLRFLDDGDSATVETAALCFLPGSKWRLVEDVQ